MLRWDTRQREAVLSYLRGTRSHPTADQVYDAVRKAVPNISKGTVYRNLQVLQEEGQVAELHLEGAPSRLEARLERHYHFRCDGCGRVFDLDEPVDQGIDQRVAARTGFKVNHHQTEFRGWCGDCQAPAIVDDQHTGKHARNALGR
jgi:Fe2+ or Zn2+ uptake regulation protein